MTFYKHLEHKLTFYAINTLGRSEKLQLILMSKEIFRLKIDILDVSSNTSLTIKDTLT